MLLDSITRFIVFFVGGSDSEKNDSLTWDARVKILRHCAVALQYLHNYINGCIVHRDIKVLTKNMCKFSCLTIVLGKEKLDLIKKFTYLLDVYIAYQHPFD